MDIDNWSYQECQDYIQQLLEVGQLTGHDVVKCKDKAKLRDDAVYEFTQIMLQSGWGKDRIAQCRNGAAGKALRRSGPVRTLQYVNSRKLVVYVGK